MKASLILLACLFAWLPGLSMAAEPLGVCNHCGCCMRKVVRLKCTTAEVEDHYYDCECEDFALLGPSKKCHVCCPSCDGCCDGKCGHQKKYFWKPGHCGKPRTRKVLVKYVMVKEEPAYECVVEYVCDRCGCGSSCVEPVDAVEDLPRQPVPPPPSHGADNNDLPLHQAAHTKDAQPSATFSLMSIFGRR